MSPESKPRRFSREELIHYPFRHPDKTLLTISKAMGALSAGSLLISGVSQIAAGRTEWLANHSEPLLKEKLQDDAKKLNSDSEEWIDKFKRFAKSSFIAFVLSQASRDPEQEFINKSLADNKQS